MAKYFCRIRRGHKGDAKKHADYIFRENSFSKAADIVAKGVVNLPGWADTAQCFFEAADIYERKNGTSYVSIDISLPCEFTLEQNLELKDRLIEYIFSDNKAGAWAIHSKQAITADVNNIHMHTMRCERIIDDEPEHMKNKKLFFKRYNNKAPEKGGYYKDGTLAQSRQKIKAAFKEVREKVAQIINEAYERVGLDIRISAKMLAEQEADARAKGDFESAELLHQRRQIKPIPMKSFKKLQSIIKHKKLIEKDDFEEFVHNGRFDVMMQELMNFDKEIALSIGETIILNLEKRQLERCRKLMKEKECRSSEDNNITVQDAIKMLENKELELLVYADSNSKYIKLYNGLYKDQSTLKRVVLDIATRGKYKQYIKKKGQAEKAEKKYLELSTSLKVPQAVIDKSFKIYQKLNDEKEQIKQEVITVQISASGRLSIEHTMKRLRENQKLRTARVKKCAEENLIIQAAVKEIKGILEDINSGKLSELSISKIKEVVASGFDHSLVNNLKTLKTSAVVKNRVSNNRAWCREC